MNQGRIWCVVKPTVGLPLLLGSVTGIALLVHGAVMSNTSWMSNYWQGNARRSADSGTAAPVATAQAAPSFSVTVTPASGAGETGFVVTVTPHASGAPSAQALVTPESGRPGSETLALAGPLTRSD